MRLDKYLKVSRLLKRRTVAKQVALGGRVTLGDKAVKPSYDVKIGDCLSIRFGDKHVSFRVDIVDEKTARISKIPMYTILHEDE